MAPPPPKAKIVRFAGNSNTAKAILRNLIFAILSSGGLIPSEISSED
jgi:hypothetical protein